VQVGRYHLSGVAAQEAQASIRMRGTE